MNPHEIPHYYPNIIKNLKYDKNQETIDKKEEKQNTYKNQVYQQNKEIPMFFNKYLEKTAKKMEEQLKKTNFYEKMEKKSNEIQDLRKQIKEDKNELNEKIEFFYKKQRQNQIFKERIKNLSSRTFFEKKNIEFLSDLKNEKEKQLDRKIVSNVSSNCLPKKKSTKISRNLRTIFLIN